MISAQKLKHADGPTSREMPRGDGKNYISSVTPNDVPPPLFPIYERGKIGYIDSTGKKIIEPSLDAEGEFYQDNFTPAQYFREGVAVAARCPGSKQECRKGFIDATGKFVIEPVFEDALQFTQGLAAVKSGGKWGFINHAGEMIITPRFVEIDSFENGFAPVMLQGGERRLINWRGKYLPMPRGVRRFGKVSELLIAVKIGGKWGFMNTRGQLVIKPRFEPYLDDAAEDAYDEKFSEGMAAVIVRGGKWGYAGRDGKMVIPARFDRATAFDNGYAAVLKNNKWRLINRAGKYVDDPKIESTYYYTEGLAMASENGKYGFADHSGKFVISPIYEAVAPFSEGFAAVRVGDKWGYVDREGKMTIGPQFPFQSRFNNGLAYQTIRAYNPATRTAGIWGYVDQTGKFVWKSGE